MVSKSPIARLHVCSLGLILALGGCIVMSLGALLVSISILTRGMRRYTYLPGDRPRELPLKVQTIQAAFHDDPDHYGIEGTRAAAEWNAIHPLGMGFVFLGVEDSPFSVSVWHQIHCLNHLRDVIVNGDDKSNHTAHCFHYLRQGILCAADTTLEPHATSLKLAANGAEIAAGDGVVHICRDWRQVYDWQQKEHQKRTLEMHEKAHGS